MATKAPDANVPPEVEALVKRLLAKEATRAPRRRTRGHREHHGDPRPARRDRPDRRAYAPPPPRHRHEPGLHQRLRPRRPISRAARSPQAAVAARRRPKAVSSRARRGSSPRAAACRHPRPRHHDRRRRSRATAAVDAEEAASRRHRTACTVAASPTRREQKIKDAIAQIDKGNYGSGIEAPRAARPRRAGPRGRASRALQGVHARPIARRKRCARSAS